MSKIKQKEVKIYKLDKGCRSNLVTYNNFLLGKIIASPPYNPMNSHNLEFLCKVILVSFIETCSTRDQGKLKI
jgi:hypothetical protein